ncbi:MAG: HIT domain-containing protein [Chloroflexi bacterium]|jgi:ATP adenylyltransferase|nr:HIT domain-containing protein [Chloroflexota bacterium]MBT3669758.1 HIT domain-containing protein [Chloroflexota bacterium]MBT4002771.1 HIT domain-containing protein [Chloroflexota bacterium]MBT4305238.1 HIT domain-containing protein [Chloroflexota bacterium]MBT4534839.1 HIT domain-containing protein [Chloroflexota bacterium]
MKNLWSPWRMSYIKSPKNKEVCVFCEAISQDEDSSNFVVHRAENSFVILNRYPYSNGHMMVIPNSHVSGLNDLNKPVRAEMMELMNKSTETLKELFQPEGFNLGVNIGEAAGAGIGDHVHLHIVPRWKGDTNFMTSLGNTRVIPESLEETYRQIKEIW